MKKLFYKLSIVLISTFLLYLSVLFISSILNFGNWLPNIKTNTGGYGHTLLRLREAENNINVDILVLGSSHAYRGFDPRIFKIHGTSLFNLGSSSQTPMNSYFLLEEHIPKMKPKNVILELYWHMLSSDALEPTIDIISNNDINKHMIEMAFVQGNAISLNCLFTSMVSRIHTPLKNSKQVNKPKDYISGGFSQSNLKENQLTEKELLKEHNKHIELDEVQLEYIYKIISLCKKHNIKLIFTIAPVTKQYFSSIENYNFYKNKLNRISKENNILLFDYNTTPNLNLSTKYDFYDAGHLTQTGVDKLNKVLINDLFKANVLPAVPN